MATQRKIKPIRMMVVGLGTWGRNWIASLQADPGYDVVALVDEAPGLAEKACAANGFDASRAFSDLDLALRHASPQAVLVVVPPLGHYAVAMRCIQEGLPVLSEKPLANDTEEAFSLLSAVEQRGLPFMVSQDYRWQPAIQTVRDLIAKGTIGEIGYITLQHFQSHRLGGWREQMRNVVLEDMSIHHFDLLRYLTGLECQRLRVDSFNPAWSWYRGGAVASVELRFERDVRALYFATWVSMGRIDPSTTGEIRIEGSRGSLIHTADGGVLLYTDGEPREVPLLPMRHTGRAYALQTFAKALREGASLETDIRDNLESFLITCAALDSATGNRPVDLEALRGGTGDRPADARA